jgi:hypothetical protein
LKGFKLRHPPKKSLKQKEKLIFFSTHVLRLNLDENFMGIADLYFASLCLFLGDFLKLKQDQKRKIFKGEYVFEIF